MEKVLTDEQLISLLDVLEEGDKSFTQASYRDLIMTAHTDMLFELGIRDVAAMEAGWKAFGGLQTKFHGKVLSIYGRFQAGTLNTASATTSFKNILKTYSKDAFMSGTQMVGNKYYSEVGMTAKDKAFISKYVRAETRHFRKFLNDIKDPKHMPVSKIPRDKSGRRLPGYRRQVHPYRQRVGYYADSLRGMGFNGMVAGAGTLLNIFWVLDKLAGRRTDHCDDCVRIAAGNPYSWQTLPTTPRAGDTQCLYKCYCGLEFQQKKGRGKEFDIPGSGSAQGLQAPNRWARIFDKFGRPIKGAPLQDIEDIYQQMNKARQMIEITKAQEKLNWIRTRQQLNDVLINQYPQYRKIPLVSVKDLTKAVKAALPARGDLLKSLANISSGAEVTFLRGNYFANGKLFLERGQWVFKDATGVRLAANLETDIIFSLNGVKPIKPSFAIKTAGKVVPKDVKDLQRTLSKLPAEHVNIVSGGYHIGTDAELAKIFGPGWEKRYAGFFKTEYDAIYIKAGYVKERYIFHEIAHAVDRFKWYPSKRKFWVDLLAKARKRLVDYPTTYSLTNEGEFFAECYSFWVYSKVEASSWYLKHIPKAAVDWFEKNYGKVFGGK